MQHAISEWTGRNGDERDMDGKGDQENRIQVEQVSRPWAPMYGMENCADALG